MNKGLLEYRAVFILLIFLYHAGLLSIGGTFGVCAFFILSGFCTTMAYKTRVSDISFSYKQYLRRRLVKYYPLHWLLLVPAFVSELFTGYTMVKSTVVLVINALLLQSLIPIKEFFFSYNAVSWYLSDTVFFVLVSPFILQVFFKLRWGGQILLMFLLMVLTVILFTLCPANMRHPLFYINPISRLVDFILGVFLAYQYNVITENETVRRTMTIFKNNSLLYAFVFIGIVITCVFIYNHLSGLGFLSSIFWSPCIVLLLLCSQCSMKRIKFVQAFGTVSFEFFMVHQLVMNFITKLRLAGFLEVSSKSLVVTLDFVAALVLAVFLHRFFTQPIINRFRIRERGV